MKETQTQFLLDIVHIPAITSIFQIKTEERTYILLKHHFMNTISLRNISALKGLSSGTTFQQRQQNVLPYVKFSLVSRVWCVTARSSLNWMLRLLHVRFIRPKDYNCDVRRKDGKASFNCPNSTRQYHTYWQAICFQTHLVNFFMFCWPCISV